MTHRAIGATTFLAPVPAVMLGVDDPSHPEREGNLITVAWCGVVCSKPPMIAVGIRPERYSYGLIREKGEFSVNLISRELTGACDLCGVKSGRDLDKFAACGLQAVRAAGISAPAIEKSPAYLSCVLRDVKPLGSHDLFLAEIIEVCVRDDLFREDGSIDMGRMDLVAYAHGQYFSLERPEGFFGYSVAKPEVRERRGKR